jgi:isoleucyl-tRNA synthetase
VLLALRDEVNRALEAARNGGTIKKPLEAKVTLRGPRDATDGFSDDDLAALFLVSQVVRADADAGGSSLSVEPADGQKCVRCWLIKRDIGADPAHPEVCARCAEAVERVLAARAAAAA